MGNVLWKQAHRAKGLCVDCSHKAVLGKLRCVLHDSRQLIRDRAYQYGETQQRLKEGRCVYCGAANHITRCPQCRELHRISARKSARKKRAWRVKVGRCMLCGYRLHPIADKGKRTCVNCRGHLWAPRIMGNALAAHYGGQRAPWGFTTGRMVSE